MKVEKIYYINLAHRKDRRTFMEGHLEQFGIEVERQEGVRPEISSLKEKNGTYHEFFVRATERFQNYVKNEKTHIRAQGVFGCYISHFLIHKKAHQDAHGDYAILEDDCQLDSKTFQNIQRALNAGIIATDWDIIRQCWHSENDVRKFVHPHRDSSYASFASSHNIFGGAHFSVFRATSSKRLLDYLESDRVMAIDAAYSTNVINVYHGQFGAKLFNFDCLILVQTYRRLIPNVIHNQ